MTDEIKPIPKHTFGGAGLISEKEKKIVDSVITDEACYVISKQSLRPRGKTLDDAIEEAADQLIYLIAARRNLPTEDGS